MIQVYVPPFWLRFLDFIDIPVDRAEISHMNTAWAACDMNHPGNQASPCYRGHMKRPLVLQF